MKISSLESKSIPNKKKPNSKFVVWCLRIDCRDFKAKCICKEP